MNWRAFEAAAPDLAAVARELFADRIGLIGTIRRDGTPRLSCIDPFIMDGELLLGMMWQSRKAVDLLRDPRIVIRNAICSNTGNEVEVTLRGRVDEVRVPAIRQRYGQMSETPWQDPFHLFAVDIESAARIAYGGGEQAVMLWPANLHFTRSYE